jgi:hypothetical protein
VTSRYIESHKINKYIIRVHHDITLQNARSWKKKGQHISGLRPSQITGIRPEDLRSTPSEFSHEQIRTHVKYTDKIPRPSHNIYTKIFLLWLSEGSLPGALRRINQNGIFIKHGRNKTLPAKNTSTQHNGCPEKELVSTRQSGNGIERKGASGHVTDHVIREHKREDRSWLLRDSWVRRGASKDSELMKRKRRFNLIHVTV